MYNKIINPKTNRSVSINSKQGKDIITTYYNILKGAGENVSRFPVTRTDHSEIWSIAGPPPPPEEQEGGGGRNLAHRRRGQNARNARSNRPKWCRIITDDDKHVWIQFRLGATGDEIVRALNVRHPDDWDCALGGDLYHNNTLYYDEDCVPIGDDRLMDWVTDDNDPEDFVLRYSAPDEEDEDDSDEDDSDEDDY